VTEKRYIVIGRSNCPFCRMAADICVAKQTSHVFLDYVEHLTILEEYKLFYEHQTVPIILENDLETGLTKKVGGYQDLLEILDC